MESLRVQGPGSLWLGVNRDAEAEADIGVLEDANRVDANEAAIWF